MSNLFISSVKQRHAHALSSLSPASLSLSTIFILSYHPILSLSLLHTHSLFPRHSPLSGCVGAGPPPSSARRRQHGTHGGDGVGRGGEKTRREEKRREEKERMRMGRERRGGWRKGRGGNEEGSVMKRRGGEKERRGDEERREGYARERGV